MSADNNIKVSIRVRNLIQKELSAGLKNHWTVVDNSIWCEVPDAGGRKPAPYTFDRVFDETTVTCDVFDEVCSPIVKSALSGFNGTIFAYGQSSSGKTFTMSGSATQEGIISLAVEEIFTSIDNIPDREFLIRVGYIEIYNEKLSDLLGDSDVPLKLQEDTDHNIQVIGLTEEMVRDGSHVIDVIKKGDRKRRFAETKQNDRSSRSHVILRFVIESRAVGHEDDAVMVSNLYFVDLAGSEKAGDNSGERFREGCAINKSLFTLGNVIRKLSGDANQQHVSFRDSKLTRILQNALGGNSKTVIICTITPAHIEESDSTLKFASRAKNIKNKPTVNEVMSDAAMLKQYRRKIQKLEEQISKIKDGDIELEKAELEKRLQEKEEYQRQQTEIISKLQTMIVTSGSSNRTSEIKPARKTRRETWCPGKAKRELEGMSDISSLRLMKKPRIAPLPNSLQETVFEEEESFQLLENISMPSQSPPFPGRQNSGTNMADVTIETNPSTMELFKLQDKYEELLDEYAKKEKDMEDMKEFHELERQCNIEEMDKMKKDLHTKECMLSGLPWLEEELMKTQMERNKLRENLEQLNRQLNSANDGSGFTMKAKQLDDSEAKCANLNSELEIQRSKYEFHIEKLKRQVEEYMMLLEEKGVTQDVLKNRISVDYSESELQVSKNTEDEVIEQVKNSHEEEVTDLRNEIDLLMISLEKEKHVGLELQKRFDEEFQQQKMNYQKDLGELKEEIEIYQQLLSEEKAKTEKNQTADSNLEYEKIEVIELKSYHEEVLAKYREEIEMYRQLLSEEKAKTESNLIAESNLELEAKEVTELKNKHDEELAIYREEIDALKTKCEDYRMHLENVDGKKIETSDMYTQNTVHEMKLKHEEELAKYREEKSALKLEYEAYGLQLEKEAKEKLDSLRACTQDELNEIQSKYDTLVIELAQYKEEICVLKKEIEDYRTQLKQVDHEKIDTRNSFAYDDFNEIKSRYEIEIANYREEISVLKKEVEDYRTQLEKVDNEKIDTQNSLSHDQLNEIKSRYDIEVANYKEEINDLKQEVEDYRTQLEMINSEKLETSKTFTQEELNEIQLKYEIQIQDLKANLECHVASKSEAKKDRHVSFNLDSEIDEQKKVIKQLTKERDMYVNLVEELTEKQGSDKQNILEIASLKKQLEYKNKDKPKNESKGEKRLAELMSEFDEMKANYENEIELLKGQVKEEKINDDNTRQQVEELKLQLKELKVGYELELERLKAEIDCSKMSSKNNEEPAELGSLQHEMLHSELDDIKEKYEMEVGDLKEQLASALKGGEKEENMQDSLEMEMLKSELYELKERYIQETADLKAELELIQSSNVAAADIQAELIVLKDNYMRETEDRKHQIDSNPSATYNGKVNIQVQMLTAELEEMKKEHAEELIKVDKKYQEEIESLRQKIENQRSSKSETHNENSNIEVEMLQAQLVEMQEKHKNEIIELKKGLEEMYQEKCEELRREMQFSAEIKPENIENVNDGKNIQSKELQSELKEMKEKYDNVMGELRRQLEDRAEHSLMEDYMEESISSNLDQSILELKERNKQLATSQFEDREACRKQIVLYDSAMDEMQTELSTMKSQLEILCKNLKAQQTANSQLKEDNLKLINMQAQHLREFQDLKEEIEKLEEEKRNLKSRILSLENSKVIEQDFGIISENATELEQSQEKVIDLEIPLCEAQDKVSNLVAELEASQEHARGLTEQINVFELEKNYFITKLDSANETIALLESKIRDNQDASNTVNAEKIEHLLEQIANTKEAQEHMKVVEKELNLKLELQITNLNKANSEVSKLTEQLKLSQDAVKDINEQLLQANDEIIETGEQLFKANEKINRLDQDLKESLEKLDINEKQMLISNEKIQDLEDQLALANDKIVELELSECRFSEQVLQLESQIEICGEYEEKIVTLESDVDTFKAKVSELEETCKDLETVSERLREELEMAQCKNMEVKDVQERYHEIISKMDQEIKNGKLIAEELTKAVQKLEDDLIQANQTIDRITEDNIKTEDEIGLCQDNMEKLTKENEEFRNNLEKAQINNQLLSDEKLNIVSELAISKHALSKLQSEHDNLISKMNKDSGKVPHLETMNGQLEKQLSSLKVEQHMLNEKVRAMLEKITQLNEHLGASEVQKNILETKLTEVMGSLEETQEKVRALELEIEQLESDKVDMAAAIQQEKAGNVDANIEELQNKLIEAEQMIETLESEKVSLQEDIYQLENGRELTLKFNTKPDNVAWEQKWREFVIFEKLKRKGLYTEIKALKDSLEKSERRRQDAFTEAMLEATQKVKSEDVYQKIQADLRRVNAEADKLHEDLLDERKVAKELRDRLARVGKEPRQGVDFMTEDHPCKYKLESFSARERLQEATTEHERRITQYKETIDQYEDRISRMKNEMRRLNSLDQTFDGRSLKAPLFDDSGEDQPPSASKTSTALKDTGNQMAMPSTQQPAQPCTYIGGSSVSGGIVDHYKVCLVEAENKRLKQDVEKMRRRVARWEELEKENITVETLRSLKGRADRLDAVEKENAELSEKIKKMQEKLTANTRGQRGSGSWEDKFRRGMDCSMLEVSTLSASPSKSARSPSKPVNGPRYHVPDLNPGPKKTPDDVDGCKPS
ncbi:centromere-associated protein E-like isoform X2 [Dreissena polymorpha]|uniref:centromere-associated protein E-like isoform X2 n=1 Tax=Dreissena polymorpha TaxID=45954 RepID=UPI002263E9FA|nr:centromere-associated protein E-like isoform X2 [Dreissena polymorpha]